ncbi:hypothetical protein DFJ77DRAFT_514166 [Powellomyces hirtus]|nr:hypothetical protein DFJ77DRAFT_514166 [Powellomyces hirtus]
MPPKAALDHALCHVDPAGIQGVAYDGGMYDWSLSDCNTWGAVLGKILVEWLCCLTGVSSPPPDALKLLYGRVPGIARPPGSQAPGWLTAAVSPRPGHCEGGGNTIPHIPLPTQIGQSLHTIFGALDVVPSARAERIGFYRKATDVGAHIKPAPLEGIVETDPADGVTLKTVQWVLTGAGPRSKTWNFHKWDNQNRQQAVAILESARATIEAIYDAHICLQEVLLTSDSPVLSAPLAYHHFRAINAIARLQESLTIIQLNGNFVFMADMNNVDICVAFGNSSAIPPSGWAPSCQLPHRWFMDPI